MGLIYISSSYLEFQKFILLLCPYLLLQFFLLPLMYKIVCTIVLAYTKYFSSQIFISLTLHFFLIFFSKSDVNNINLRAQP